MPRISIKVIIAARSRMEARAMTARQLRTFQGTLEAKLQQAARPSEMVSGLYVEKEPDPIDDAQSKSLRELAVYMMNTDWQVHKAIEAALVRIESGEYGLCEECNEPIVLRRLKALPWATRCVACQEESEAALMN